MYLGGFPVTATVLLFAIIGMQEFYYAMHQRIKWIDFVGYIFACMYVVFILPVGQSHIMFFLFIFLLSLLLLGTFFHRTITVIDISITIMGFLYVCFLFSYILLVRNYENGFLYVWLIFISAWGSDTGAYFAGITLGKHKLCADLSPKKTIEGSIGGILAAALLSLLYGFFILKMGYSHIQQLPYICSFIGAIGGAISQVGDLTASSIKRYVNIKDYGSIIPGHGGMLDRCDSILFTAPFVYYIMTWLI